MVKEECLARWRAAKDKRVQIAQKILKGKAKMNMSWPLWVQYDIKAEMKVIQADRSQSKKAYRAKRGRYEADLFD